MQLFRATAPPSASLAEQVAALATATAEQLAAIAGGEGEPGLREAAIALLPDGATLRWLAGLDGAAPAGAQFQALARRRLAALVDAGSLELDSLNQHATDPIAVLAVADSCSDPARLEQALAAVQDPLIIERLVLEGDSLRLRQLAAERVEGREELNRLLKQLQGKDKSVYRILKDKRDALRAEAKQASQLDAEIRTVCVTLESLASHPHDPMFEHGYELFAARWRALESQAQPWIRERTLAALGRCREFVEQLRQRRSEQAELAAQQAAREDERRAARAAAEVQALDANRMREEQAAQAAIEAASARAAEEQARAARVEAETRALGQVAKLLTRAHGALRAGRSGPAAGIRRALEERLAAPGAPALPPGLARSLQELDAQLGTLRAWKDYAVTPKRTELVAAMEALVGSSEAPQALAGRIRELRAHWKTISQGVVTDSGADWERFNQAATSAYEPCRLYFEEQARVRAANLEQRQQLLARLQAFEARQDDEHPDWRAIGTVLREAAEEWRRAGPVDRDAFKAIQTEFSAALARLRARLEAWQSQNAAARESLIQRAQALAIQEDNRAAVEAIKALQRQWQEIGPAPRQRERALWEQFRAQCDAVFRQREQLQVERSASLQDSKSRAIALCEELEALAAGSGAALLASPKNAPEWRADFDAIGELPRPDEQALRRRFEQALKHCANLASQQRARDRTQAYDHLLEAARRIHRFGWAVMQGADEAERDALRQDAEAFIATAAQWPKGGDAALGVAWAAAQSSATRTGTSGDTATNEAALRLLCVRGEVHGERPTPGEDEALRRSYQLQRLVKGMGRREQEAPGDWESLALEWVRVGPVAPAVYDALLARFSGGR